MTMEPIIDTNLLHANALAMTRAWTGAEYMDCLVALRQQMLREARVGFIVAAIAAGVDDHRVYLLHDVVSASNRTPGEPCAYRFRFRFGGVWVAGNRNDNPFAWAFDLATLTFNPNYAAYD